ncbi:hypothetical protein [Malonomonas rubra]
MEKTGEWIQNKANN